MKRWRSSSCAATWSRTSLAANLRRAFSGIVAGNVKEQGIQAIEARVRSSCMATRRS